MSLKRDFSNVKLTLNGETFEGMKELTMRPTDAVCCNCGRDLDSEQGWAIISGLDSESVTAWWCPKCKDVLRVGMDWAIANGGNGGGYADSVACAWAFQFGQYCAHPDFASQLGRYLANPARADAPHNNMMGPNFCAPQTWGLYGWERWSTVRRTAEEQQRRFYAGTGFKASNLETVYNRLSSAMRDAFAPIDDPDRADAAAYGMQAEITQSSNFDEFARAVQANTPGLQAEPTEGATRED